MEPWQLYYEELERRAQAVPDNAFGRDELIANAAHDAYQSATNRLTADGWDSEKALMVTRMFGQAVKEWLARDNTNWSELRAELDRRYQDWSQQRD